MIARNPAIWAGALDGDPASKGRAGVVFDGALDHLRMLRAMDAGEQGEGHVDAGRYARGGDHLSGVPPPAARCSGHRGVPAARRVPSECWPLARRGSRRRPGRSNRCTRAVQAAVGVDLAQPLHHLLVGILLGQAAADDHHIGRRQFREGGRCGQRAAARTVGHRPGGHEHGVMARYTGEHLEWPDDVQAGEPRIEDKRDLHGSVRPLAGTLSAGRLLRFRDGYVLLLLHRHGELGSTAPNGRRARCWAGPPGALRTLMFPTLRQRLSARRLGAGPGTAASAARR